MNIFLLRRSAGNHFKQTVWLSSLCFCVLHSWHEICQSSSFMGLILYLLLNIKILVEDWRMDPSNHNICISNIKGRGTWRFWGWIYTKFGFQPYNFHLTWTTTYCTILQLGCLGTFAFFRHNALQVLIVAADYLCNDDR